MSHTFPPEVVKAAIMAVRARGLLDMAAIMCIDYHEYQEDMKEGIVA